MKSILLIFITLILASAYAFAQLVPAPQQPTNIPNPGQTQTLPPTSPTMNGVLPGTPGNNNGFPTTNYIPNYPMSNTVPNYPTTNAFPNSSPGPSPSSSP